MSEEYEVGYGKPPKHSRFKKGQIGQPKRSAKGHQKFKDRSDRGARRNDSAVHEGDRPTKISKQHVFVKTLVQRSLKGDARATATLMNLMLRVFDLGDATADENLPLTSEEREVLTFLEERIRNETASGRTDDRSGGDGTSS